MTMRCETCGQDNPRDARFCKSCGIQLGVGEATVQIAGSPDQSESVSEELIFDDMIVNQRFKIIKILGRGGMGNIYLARDQKLKRDVAIKCISEKTLNDFYSKARFLREAQTASQLEHTNICTIYEIYEEEKNNYIVMQYVDGVTLDQIINLKKLSINKILDIAIQICDAMIEAHSKQIIHRDIKPANVMIDQNGSAKILDFGLAKFRDESIMKKKDVIESTHITKKGILMGTVCYMSPEQARGERLEPTSDIFSFGVVLYEMLEGINPFQDKDHICTLYNVINRDIDFFRDIPEDLKQIVRRCLEKNPKDRFADFQAIKVKLELFRGVYFQLSEVDQDNFKTEIIDTRDQSKWMKEIQKTSDQEGLGDIVNRIKKIKAHTEPVISSRRRIMKIVSIPLMLIIIAGLVLILSGIRKERMLIPDDNEKFYVYLHDFENKTGEEQLFQGLNYLLDQSLNQFQEFKTINEEIASGLDIEMESTSSAHGILVPDGGPDSSKQVSEREKATNVLNHQSTLIKLMKKFNVLFELKGTVTQFNDFYNIDAELIPVVRGKKHFPITIPIQNMDVLLSNQVDALAKRVYLSIFGKKQREEVIINRISDIYGSDWKQFLIFFRGFNNYQKLRFSQAELDLGYTTNLPAAKYLLADIFYFQGKREQARKLIRDVFQMKDIITESIRLRIQALKSRLDFNFKDEIESLEKLTEEFSFLPDAFFELGEAYFHRGDAEKAIGYYQQSLDINKKNSRAINHLGYCYSYLGDHNQAIQRFEDYRNLDQSANSFDSLGDGYFYSGDLTSSEAMKLAALSKDSKSVPWSYLTLADIYTLRAEYRKVKPILQQYNSMTNSKKEMARSLVKQAYIHFLEKKLKQAVSLLDQSLSTFNSPDINDYTVAEAHWLRGIVLLNMNRIKECQGDLDWLIGIKERYNLSDSNFYIPYKYYLHLKALVAEKKGNTDMADNCFLNLMKLKTRLSYWVTGFHAQFFHTEFIRYLKRNQRFREAKEEIENCLRFNPNYIPCLWEKAGLMTILKTNSEALNTYQKIVELYGDSTEQNLLRKLLKNQLARMRKLN